jgi:hypothetical protein
VAEQEAVREEIGVVVKAHNPPPGRARRSCRCLCPGLRGRHQSIAATYAAVGTHSGAVGRQPLSVLIAATVDLFPLATPLLCETRPRQLSKGPSMDGGSRPPGISG